MKFIVRTARPEDLQALYDMAKVTGGGFTNLPADRGALSAKLERSMASLARPEDEIGDNVVLFVLENRETGQIRGTCQIFSQVGATAPFYSYRIGTLTQHSRELNRTFRAQLLSLTTDLEGATEVGGLFLHPRERAEGLGLLLARSRYLYIRQHRARFGERILAELRGVIDEAGSSPFWDGLAGRFFGMSFQEADAFNALHGNQFIADLMPKTPIYVEMLSEQARSVIGRPHPNGRAAMRMLETEGFKYNGYIDIFDGGPTMLGKIDNLRTVSKAHQMRYRGTHGEQGTPMMVATGRLGDFRCAYGRMQPDQYGGAWLDEQSAELLGLLSEDDVLVTER